MRLGWALLILLPAMAGGLRGVSLFLNAYVHRHVFLRSMD